MDLGSLKARCCLDVPDVELDDGTGGGGEISVVVGKNEPVMGFTSIVFCDTRFAAREAADGTIGLNSAPSGPGPLSLGGSMWSFTRAGSVTST